ncbi:MAG: hypothetical protein A3K19_29045 [Lentisphaerae bacterium RIFOXYB12_FULL_65_16]|nr:MAG: hypothetical protein A3K18_25630 [Lentisphaerae bacterium RIFOXYA12_64_32]OGV88338.1 MAG: hypothetical protein A3K19_29045 [Lentisphaerae bacterium RIFOXYB12_FULL_65_16]
MKRTGNLFEAICSWENLELAARRARRGKRYRRYAEEFELRRETILGRLREELLEGRWRPSPPRTFTLFDPKERVICAPPYRDRIVHHALCNVIGPVLDRSMVAQSYSCRVGKGTGAARDECRRLARTRRYVLKLDVRKYFPSIDHERLKVKVRRLIKCAPTLTLIDLVIDAWDSGDEGRFWFPGDTLFTPCERRHGLPIGSLTSQLFANLYLSRIDHLVIEQLRPAGYVRYTDDLLLFSDSKAALHSARARLAEELRAERLLPHPSKCRVHACREGVPFLGFRFFPDGVRVLRQNRLRFERRMACLRRRMAADHREWTKVWPSMFGWFQFVREQPGGEGLVAAECRRQRF